MKDAVVAVDATGPPAQSSIRIPCATRADRNRSAGWVVRSGPRHAPVASARRAQPRCVVVNGDVRGDHRHATCPFPATRPSPPARCGARRNQHDGGGLSIRPCGAGFGVSKLPPAVGSGDLTARAREDGGDEVAALARAFNQMTQDLHARAAQIQAADRTRRLLLADVSHELMTPLTGMRGYLETLSLHADSLDPATRERYLSIVRDETRRVEHIIGDLLDLARLEGGGESFDAQDVPLEDVFGRVRARHQHEAEQSGVMLTTDITPGAEIVTGVDLLEQALQNLLRTPCVTRCEGARRAC